MSFPPLPALSYMRGGSLQARICRWHETCFRDRLSHKNFDLLFSESPNCRFFSTSGKRSTHNKNRYEKDLTWLKVGAFPSFTVKLALDFDVAGKHQR